MKQLFKRLPLTYPLIFTERELLKLITIQEMQLLSNSAILVRGTPVEQVSCQTCTKYHEVYVEDRKLFYICPDAGKEYVEKIDLSTWVFSCDHLFNSLIREFNLVANIQEKQKNTLWLIGTTHLNKNIVPVYFSRGRIDNTLLKTTPGIIITARCQTGLNGENITKLVPLEDLTTRKIGKYLWDKKIWQASLTHFYKRTIFEPNGDLLVDDKRVASVKPASASYYFLEILHKHYNDPVSQKEIFSYCEQKLAKLQGIKEWKSDYTEQTFCNKMKALIKQDATDKGMVNKIIQSTRTSNNEKAYRLTNSD